MPTEPIRKEKCYQSLYLNPKETPLEDNREVMVDFKDFTLDPVPSRWDGEKFIAFERDAYEVLNNIGW